MTPESIQLAREITEAAIFDAGERRTECLRQAEGVLGDHQANDLLGEAARLAERVGALQRLECELKQEAASDGEDIFS